MTGNQEAAFHHFQRAVEVNPRDPFILSNMAAALVQIGRIEDAIPYAEKALDIDPDREDYLGAHARIAAWISRMRSTPGYDPSHAAWNHVVPLITERLQQAPCSGTDPTWVADACSEVLR